MLILESLLAFEVVGDSCGGGRREIIAMIFQGCLFFVSLFSFGFIWAVMWLRCRTVECVRLQVVQGDIFTMYVGVMIYFRGLWHTTQVVEQLFQVVVLGVDNVTLD